MVRLTNIKLKKMGGGYGFYIRKALVEAGVIPQRSRYVITIEYEPEELKGNTGLLCSLEAIESPLLVAAI